MPHESICPPCVKVRHGTCTTVNLSLINADSNRKMKAKNKKIAGVGLIGLTLCGIAYVKYSIQPVSIDFSKMANQSPEFVDHYLGGQHSISFCQTTYGNWFGPKMTGGTQIPVEEFDYPEDKKGESFIGVQFYKGKAVRFLTQFSEPESVSSTARRVGLNFSAFHPIFRRGKSNVFYTVVDKGVVFNQVMLTNVENEGKGGRTIAATVLIPAEMRG